MNNFFKRTLCTTALMAGVLGLAIPKQVSAFTLWDESSSVYSDLSDDGLNPTAVGPLELGTNSLAATFNAGTENPSPDYFTITIPDGLVLEEIKLQSWESSPTFEDIAFIAVQRGTIFDYEVPEDKGSSAGLLGWSHLRSTQVGTNKVLQEIAVSNQDHETSGTADFYRQEAASHPYPQAVLDDFPELPENLTGLSKQWAPGAEGFKRPLTSGDYTFWLRQGSDTNITAKLDFKTAKVPEPISIFGTGLALGFGFLFRRKKH